MFPLLLKINFSDTLNYKQVINYFLVDLSAMNDFIISIKVKSGFLNIPKPYE